MMKKIIALMVGLLFINSVTALTLPCPIGGKIINNNGNVNGLTVILTNARTNEVMNVYSNSAGEFIVDWANTIDKYADGDKINIVIKECETNDVCKFSVTIHGNPIYLEMDISDAGLDYCPPVDCPDYPVCPDCPDCICPTTITTTSIPCEVCEECPTCPVCNDIFAAVAAIFIGFGFGYGYKVYTTKTGQVVGLHKHPGIIAYHNPDTLHSNPKIRHPKGMINPKYAKDEAGKWYYVGG